MVEKLKQRTIWLTQQKREPAVAESAMALLRDVRGVLRVRISGKNRLLVSYNSRQITLQIIEALLQEFGYTLRNSLFCRMQRAVCYYIEDNECSGCKHDQADCTRDAFITRYLGRQHGCRDHRLGYLRHY